MVTDPAYSGLLQRGYPKREVVRQIRVRVDRLDNIIPQDAPVALIKIDVEGGEYGVLAGGVRTIRRTRPVIIFEHGASSRKYGVTSEMIYRLLTRTLGLRVSLMSCWLAGEPPLTREQFLEQYRAGRNWYFIAHPVSRPARHRR